MHRGERKRKAEQTEQRHPPRLTYFLLHLSSYPVCLLALGKEEKRVQALALRRR